MTVVVVARYLGAALAVLGFAAALALWHGGGGRLDVAWAPTLDLRLAFALDGLAALFTLLATGIGFLTFIYSTRYLRLHLAHQGRPPRDEVRFYALLFLFMGSMVGLVTAQDLILLFVFWDLTSVASYFLIAYDRHEREARWAALMALLVTGGSAVPLLIGILLLHAEHATFSLPELVTLAEPGPTVTAAGALFALAALVKSAQVPFHFWLRRAMVAPTPVSAYLHSAALVAAGVFLLIRLYPLLEPTAALLDALLVVGLASMVAGAVLALVHDPLKQVLAYSTVAQYGYVVFLVGLGRPALGAAAFYVLAHALVKSALFMTAGAVAQATGRAELSRLGGLARRLPLLAVSSGAAAAGLAALPLTLGFFKDELFFAAALERGGPLLGVLAVLGAALTFAYVWRFWSGIFLGERDGEPSGVPRGLAWPVAVLAAVVLLGGIVPGPFAALAEAAADASVGGATAVAAAYHADARAENLMALATYALGALAIVSRPLWNAAAVAVARAGARLGPEQVYLVSLAALARASDRIHEVEVRDLRTRVTAVLLPAGALVALGLAFTPVAGTYRIGGLAGEEVPLALVLAATALAAVAACVPRVHLTLLLVLASAGFSLAVAYAFFGAPDVALVAVLVETLLALLFLGTFALLPREVLAREAAVETTTRRRRRDLVIAVAAGGAAFLVVWGALSRPAPEQHVAAEHVRLARAAHGDDVVTTILTDFRALDTLGEITVVVVAFVGVATLLAGGRLWARR